MKRIKAIVLSILMCNLIIGLYCPILHYANNSLTAEAALYNERLYNQNSTEWSSSLKSSGCMIFSFANAIYALNGNRVDINELTTWARNNGSFQPGNGGGYRHTFYSKVEAAYGKKYQFTLSPPMKPNGETGIFSNVTSSTLKNHLSNGGVAAAHVDGHFIALTDYNAGSDEFFVVESYIVNHRGMSAASWVTSKYLLTHSTSIVDWFILISSTGNPEPPTYSTLSSNKTNYNLGETVTFTASSDRASGYTIGINKGSERIITQDLNGNTFSFTPSAGGEYSAYVSAWNSVGLKDSAVITFNVTGESPKNPALTLKDGKTLFAEDETVVFTASATGATGYTIGIDKGGKRIVTQDLNGTTFTFTPQGAGDYYSYVTAWNNAGLTDSKGLTFKVYNSAPTKSEIAIANEKSIYETGSEIAINVTSDTATGYTIGIDRNGERIVTKDFHDSTFKFTPTEPGDYYTYVTSWNKYGIKDSKGISFKVCNSKPTFSELSATSNSIGVGEQISFTAKSDNANAYWIGIDLKGERYLTEEMIGGNLDWSFSIPGDYTAYVTSSNKFGYVDSKLIRFTVLSPISGDCNNDGEFSIADVVELQKWILAVPDTKLKNWKAADLCEDGVINTFDLVMMKRMLINK